MSAWNSRCFLPKTERRRSSGREALPNTYDFFSAELRPVAWLAGGYQSSSLCRSSIIVSNLDERAIAGAGGGDHSLLSDIADGLFQRSVDFLQFAVDAHQLLVCRGRQSRRPSHALVCCYLHAAVGGSFNAPLSTLTCMENGSEWRRANLGCSHRR